MYKIILLLLLSIFAFNFSKSQTFIPDTIDFGISKILNKKSKFFVKKNIEINNIFKSDLRIREFSFEKNKSYYDYNPQVFSVSPEIVIQSGQNRNFVFENITSVTDSIDFNNNIYSKLFITYFIGADTLIHIDSSILKTHLIKDNKLLTVTDYYTYSLCQFHNESPHYFFSTLENNSGNDLIVDSLKINDPDTMFYDAHFMYGITSNFLNIPFTLPKDTFIYLSPGFKEVKHLGKFSYSYNIFYHAKDSVDGQSVSDSVIITFDLDDIVKIYPFDLNMGNAGRIKDSLVSSECYFYKCTDEIIFLDSIIFSEKLLANYWNAELMNKGTFPYLILPDSFNYVTVYFRPKKIGYTTGFMTFYFRKANGETFIRYYPLFANIDRILDVVENEIFDNNNIIIRLKDDGITIESKDASLKRIIIYDILGNIKEMENPNSDFVIIPTSSYQAGCYFLNIINGTDMITKKFFILK